MNNFENIVKAKETLEKDKDKVKKSKKNLDKLIKKLLKRYVNYLKENSNLMLDRSFLNDFKKANDLNLVQINDDSISVWFSYNEGRGVIESHIRKNIFVDIKFLDDTITDEEYHKLFDKYRF